MTRPNDELIADADGLVAFIRGILSNPFARDREIRTGFNCCINLLTECRAALATAREDGAREERDRIVTWLQTQAVFNRGISCFASAFACDSAASAVASGKHRAS